jgi:hypothetical protein
VGEALQKPFVEAESSNNSCTVAWVVTFLWQRTPLSVYEPFWNELSRKAFLVRMCDPLVSINERMRSGPCKVSDPLTGRCTLSFGRWRDTSIFDLFLFPALLMFDSFASQFGTQQLKFLGLQVP